MTDLVVLVADKDAEQAISALLGRHELLGIRPITRTVIRSDEHDPGVFHKAADLLRLYLRTHRHALAMLDREGSGRDNQAREDIERHLEDTLRRNGWQDRCAVIVMDPELESWVWSDSDEIAKALGWVEGLSSLRSWLRESRLVVAGRSKPAHPKEAMLAALRQSRTPKSSAIFAQLASTVDPSNCTDPAYLKLARTLRGWFAHQA